MRTERWKKGPEVAELVYQRPYPGSYTRIYCLEEVEIMPGWRAPQIRNWKITVGRSWPTEEAARDFLRGLGWMQL